MNKVAEMVAWARKKELDRLTEWLALAATVDLSCHDSVVEWSDIPAELHPYLQESLFGCTVPLSGIYVWDFRRCIGQLGIRYSALLVEKSDLTESQVLYDWNVYVHGSAQNFTRHLFGTLGETVRWTSPISEFDLQNMTIVTTMGKKYWLRGAPVRSRHHEQIVGGIATRINTMLRSWV